MSGITNCFVSETHCVGETTCFTWKIHDYHASPLKKKKVLLSDFFVFENTRFCLRAQYVFVNYYYPDNTPRCYALSVCLVANSTLPEVDFTYFISLKNKENKHEYQRKSFVKSGVRPIELHVVSETKVSDSTSLLVDDCLTLHCKMVSFRTTHKSNFPQTQGAVSCCSYSDALSRDFRSLLTSKDKADFVFRVEGLDIPIHSLIVSARSSVFAAMFQSDFKDNHTRVMNITDMGISEMNCLLEYIYTGEVRELKELSSDSLADLYSAAEKYDLKELKIMCSQDMQTKLTKDNLEKYATLAFTHDDQNIMAAVVTFFGSNKDLMDSDLMQDLAKKNPSLLVQILKFVTR